MQYWSWFAVDFLALILALATLAHLHRQRQEPGALSLTAAVGAAAAWSMLDFAKILSRDPGQALEIARWEAVPEVFLVLAWLVFTLAYTGQMRHLRRWPVLLLVAAGVVTVTLAAAGDPWGWLLAGGALEGAGGSFGFAPDPGAWMPVHQGWFWGTVVFSTGVLALHVAQSPRHVGRLVFVLGAPLLLATAHAVSPGIWAVPEWVSLQPLGASLGLGALGWGLLRAGDESVAPVARNVVVEEMEDAVVVLDRKGRIVDVNRSARERLGLRLLGPVPMALGEKWESVRDRLGTPGMPVSERLDLPVKGGETASFEMSVTLLGPQGGQDRSVLVLRDITLQAAMEQDLRDATQKLHKLAHTDELTGLWNRRHLVDRLHAEVERSRRYGRPLALILLDLDHFKTINDTYGHAAGDEVLRVTSRAMEAICRDLDVPGRMGGEEFAVVLPETDAKGARVVADRLRLEIASCLHEAAGHPPFRVTASLGVVTLEPGSERDVESLMHAADAALYRAKELGRNRVTLTA